MADAEARLTEIAPVGFAAGVCAVVAWGALVLARSGSLMRPAVRCRESISSYSSRSSPERARARARARERERLDELVSCQILAFERQSARARARERERETRRARIPRDHRLAATPPSACMPARACGYRVLPKYARPHVRLHILQTYTIYLYIVYLHCSLSIQAKYI